MIDVICIEQIRMRIESPPPPRAHKHAFLHDTSISGLATVTTMLEWHCGKDLECHCQPLRSPGPHECPCRTLPRRWDSIVGAANWTAWLLGTNGRNRRICAHVIRHVFLPCTRSHLVRAANRVWSDINRSQVAKWPSLSTKISTHGQWALSGQI